MEIQYIMKALLLNGSPREGNTATALQALKRGLAHIDNLEIREIVANDVSVSPCQACGICKDNGGTCVFDDDTNDVIAAVLDADLLVFATPVYWWGMSAQLKLIIDKFYTNTTRLQQCEKQVGIIVIGELAQGDPQYEMIPNHFRCIADYLGWNVAFCGTYSACAADDLAGNTDAIAELEEFWKQCRL